MDTSKEYIKMADCPEIQSQWKKLMGEHDYTQEIFKQHPKYKTQQMTVPIWLPRQDQIQEMLQPIELHELLDICGEADGIMWKALHEYAESFEQLWLAFYMYEKHKKVWNGEQWIKEK